MNSAPAAAATCLVLVTLLAAGDIAVDVHYRDEAAVTAAARAETARGHKVQIKRLHGERAIAVETAADRYFAALELGYEDADWSPVVDAYLAA